jgi:outer membrane lipoprotein SlyB
MRGSEVIGCSLAFLTLCSACTTTSYNQASYGLTATAPPSPSTIQKTAMQRAIGNCLVSVGFGAVGGAILGQIFSRNAGSGAAIGAAVGVGACAVLLKVASDEDQARMRNLEEQAVSSGNGETQTFVTKSGEPATVTTVVTSAAVPAANTQVKTASAQPTFTDCRYSTQSVQVAGQSASSQKQLWCRVPAGDWQPVQT